MRNQLKLHKKKYLGLYYALAGTFLLSTNFITAKYALKGFNPETFSLIWTSAAALYALLIIVSKSQTKELRVKTDSRNKIILLGIITGAGMIFTWAGLALLDPTFQAFLFRFTPVINILFGSILFGEVLRLKEIFPIIVVVFGGLFSSISDWKVISGGIILTLLAVLTTSVQLFIGKDRIKTINPGVLVFYRAAIGSVVIFIWTFSAGKLVIDASLSFWIVLLTGAFLGPTLSFLFLFHSFRYWEFYRTSVVLTIQPLIVLPLSYMFLDALPNRSQLLGGLLMMVGVLWLILIHIRHGKIPTSP